LIDVGKSGSEVTTPNSKNEFVVGQHCNTLSSVLPPQKKHHFGPKDPENPFKHKYANFCLECSLMAGTPAL